MIDLKVIDDPNHYLLIAKKQNKEYLKRFEQALKPLKKCLTQKQFNNLCENKLQIRKGQFKEIQFIQNATEVTILSYFSEKFKKDFIYENKINPPKDVDLSIKINDLICNIEIKCVDNTKIDEIKSDKSTNKVSMFGRYPNKEFINDVMSKHNEDFQNCDDVDTKKSLLLIQNRDLKLKEYLLSAQSKFSDKYSTNHLNILFINIGDLSDQDEWDSYLYGHQGIFQKDSFINHNEFDKVDFIIIGNLQHRHSKFYEKKDLKNHWKLNRAYCILHGNKFSKNYMILSKLDILNKIIPQIAIETRQFVDITDSSKKVGLFRHSYYVSTVLNHNRDYRF